MLTANMTLIKKYTQKLPLYSDIHTFATTHHVTAFTCSAIKTSIHETVLKAACCTFSRAIKLEV